MSAPRPPGVRRAFDRAALLISVCALAIAACRSADDAGVRLTLQLAAGAQRPDYVVIKWFAPGDDDGTDHRYPDQGTLRAGNSTLGSVFFQLADRGPGERRVFAVGMTGERPATFAAERIAFERGQVDVTLVLAGTTADSDADGLPDAIDDDCGSANCTPRRTRDGGAGDAADSFDAPVTAAPVDGARERSALGSLCAAPDDCASGFCVDGVCCDAACASSCSACDLPGVQGRCTPVPAGEDPDDDCESAIQSTCGTDGTCDGSGACRLFTEGTKCAPAACAGGAYTPSRTCDGKGLCRPGQTTTCGGYVCESAEACHTRCTTSSQCSSGNVCLQGACSGPKPIGAACAAAAECVSQQCAQGVCCATACQGGCSACNVAGSVGTCAPIPAGQDPQNHCSDAGSTTCGSDGTCDGTGKCRSYAAGTQCAVPTCSDVTATRARTCDGNGTCRPAVTVPCSPFACGGNQCRTSCADDAQCATTAACTGGICVPKRGNGEACSAARECQSGVCASGVCCDRACSGTCQACNLVGSVGTCKLVPAGQDPLDQCADLGAGTCGTDGTCNGNGACRLFVSGTACGGGSCAQAVQTPPSTCNGTGACVPSAPTSCGRFQCAGTVCRTGCLVDADCVAPHACGAGHCGGLRGEYFQNPDLTGSVVVRVDPRVYFDWGTGSPAAGVDLDTFSVRWTGKITPRFSEMYQLTAGTDDGVRLWIDGALVVDAWVGRPYTENTAAVSLTAGRAHDIVMEYFDQWSYATAHLLWQSPSQPREVVPAWALTPAP